MALMKQNESLLSLDPWSHMFLLHDKIGNKYEILLPHLREKQLSEGKVFVELSHCFLLHTFILERTTGNQWLFGFEHLAGAFSNEWMTMLLPVMKFMLLKLEFWKIDGCLCEREAFPTLSCWTSPEESVVVRNMNFFHIV